MKTTIKLTAVLLIAFYLMSCASTKKLTAQELATGDFGPYPANYQEMIQDYFSTKLYDPYSAVYYFWEPKKHKDGHGYGWKVEMEVNAKNRMGGYTGRERYHFMINADKIWPTDEFKTGIYNGLSR